MDRDTIIRLAREAGFADGVVDIVGAEGFANFAALVAAAEREKVVRWMMERGYATGHGDTIEDLLTELEWQVRESERKACAKLCDEHAKRNYNWASENADIYHAQAHWARRIAAAIRARGKE